MKKTPAVKISPASDEPVPEKLILSTESEGEEECEEDESEEEEEDNDTEETSIEEQNILVPPSPPKKMRSKKYQLPVEQLNWLDNQTDKEKSRPKLENGNQSNWKKFKAEHKVYREELNGNQPMVKLISSKARNGLLIPLKMNTLSFLKLTDEQITIILDKHFKLNQISNYKEILSSCHMVQSTNDNINIDKIQLYTEDFIDKLSINPHFQRDKLKGAPPKIINEIFIDGLQPPVFRAVVRDLGTTKINSTIRILPDIYSESEIYMKWKQRSDETDDETESVLKIDEIVSTLKRDNKVTIKGKFCSYCIDTRPYIARGHTDANCYYLHPEKRKEMESERAQRERDIPKVANAAQIQTMQDEIRQLEQNLIFMTVKLEKDENA